MVPTSRDRAAFELLSRELDSARQSLRTAKQERTGVLKEAWVAGRYIRMASPRSELFLLPDQKDAIEELADLSAHLYETGEDRLRFFESKNARFYYRAERLQAEDVHFLDYRLVEMKGDSIHELGHPFMSGMAEKLECTVLESGMDVVAYGVEADFEHH